MYYARYGSPRHECRLWPLCNVSIKDSITILKIPKLERTFEVDDAARVHRRDDFSIIIPGIAPSAPDSVLQNTLGPAVVIANDRIRNRDRSGQNVLVDRMNVFR